jgi:ribonuclease HII
VGASRAVSALTCRYDVIIIDGISNLLPGENTIVLPKADLHIPQVAAASIVAKVARDNYMHRLHRQDNRYGFDRHVGYGTQLHAKMLGIYGPSKHHRISFRPIQEAALVQD